MAPSTAPPFAPLVIQAGDDWGVPISVYKADGITLLEVDNPVLVMRRDPNPNGQLIAQFDTTGQADGLLAPGAGGIGEWIATLPYSFTTSMLTGRGFWAMFGFITGKRTLVANGVVEIIPSIV